MTSLKSCGSFSSLTAWIAVALTCLLLVPGCSSRAIEPAVEFPGRVGIPDPVQFRAAGQTAGFRLIPAPLETVTTSGRKARLSLLAPASRQARIVDQKRHVVRAAPPGGTITELQVSPGGKYVLLNFGDATYTIADAETLQDFISLPKQPPTDDDATGFRWFFLDENFMFGASELPSTDTEGRTASEIDALPPRATLPYLYDLEKRKLIPVAIDDSLPQLFLIHAVSGWSITLLTYDSDLVGATIGHPSE